MWIAAAVIAFLFAVVAVAFLIGDSPLARKAGLVVAFLAMGIGIPGGEPRMVHTVLGAATALIAVRGLDLYLDPGRYPFAWRVFFVGSVSDARKLRRVGGRFDVFSFSSGLAFAALGALAACGVLAIGAHPTSTVGWVARWAVGLVFVYSIIDCVGRMAHTLYRALGFELSPLHDNPILSRTIQEFWSLRWNLATHDVLMRHLFAPFARRRHPKLAVMMTFIGSGVLHFWITILAIGWVPAVVQGLFFVVQGFLVLTERKLRVARWRAPSQRAWTIGAFALTSPLFVEPFLQTVGF